MLGLGLGPFFTEDFSSVEEELAQMLVPAIDRSFESQTSSLVPYVLLYGKTLIYSLLFFLSLKLKSSLKSKATILIL